MTATVLPGTRIRFIRPFTARVINPVTRRFAGWLPGFAILTHVGRASGRVYRTPINVFRSGDHYLFALTYGSDVDWVKNVLAAGGCDMRSRGRDIRLIEPEVIVDPDLRLMPWPLAPVLGRLNRVTEILRMRPVDQRRGSASGALGRRRSAVERVRTGVYWFLVLGIVYENLAGAIWVLLGLDYLPVTLRHLGYPPYFANIVGFWQFLAALVILAPRLGLAKEWAYAGVFFNYTAAVYSHVLAGDGPDTWSYPLIFAALAVGAWALRPPEHRVVVAGDAKPGTTRSWVVWASVLVAVSVLALVTTPAAPVY